MHYKNGREAKNGDKVVFECNGELVVGVLYDATPGNDYCNGRLAPLATGGSFCPNLKECLRLDDAVAQLKTTPALGSPKAEDVPPGVQTI